jgi:hypothetical protein
MLTQFYFERLEGKKKLGFPSFSLVTIILSRGLYSLHVIIEFAVCREP